MRKLIVCGVGLVAALALTVPGAIGGPGQTPGVTAKTIAIGGTFPLTGPAASYAPIPLGMKAYFSYINARRAAKADDPQRRGVFGRQIIWKYYDDGYNPANTAQLTRRLVEQDKVFATVGQLGTEPVLGARALPEPAEGAAGARLDRRVVLGRSSTRSSRGRSAGSLTTSPKGASTALHVKANFAGKKIAIIYQNDDYGKDYLYGFRAALGKTYADANIVAQEAVEATATLRGVADDEDQGERRDDPRRLPAPDADRPHGRDRQGARLQPRADLHELGRERQAGDRRHGRLRRCPVHQRDHHRSRTTRTRRTRSGTTTRR